MKRRCLFSPVCSHFKTGKDIKNEIHSKIAFQVPTIDYVLQGGIRLSGLTEISGEGGSGKTQLAMNLCLTAQLPRFIGGLGKKTIYINTEGSFASERFLQLARNLIKRFGHKATAEEMLQNVIYVKMFEHADLLNFIELQLPIICQKEPIGLIVIDSIAAIYRLDTEYIKRARKMRRIVLSLVKHSVQYKFGVVCVNQVSSTKFGTKPSLGFAWSKLVSTRLQIRKEESLVLNGKTTQKRKLIVSWSPNVPTGTATFYINEDGISS